MRAVISGQARVALLWEGDRLSSLHSRSGKTPVERSPRDIPYLLGDANDLRFLAGIDEDHAVAALAQAVDEENALHLTLLLLDPTLRPDTRRDASLELEELLAAPTIRGFLERIFWSRPLPREADLPGALAQKAGTTDAVGGFLRELVALQMPIAEVVAAWQSIPEEILEPVGRGAAQTVAVESGLFRNLVLNLHERHSIDRFLRHSLLEPSLKRLANHREILSAWVKPLRQSRNPSAYSMNEARPWVEEVAEGPEDGETNRRDSGRKEAMTEADLARITDLLVDCWQAPGMRTGTISALAERIGRLLPEHVRGDPTAHLGEIEAILAQLAATDLIVGGLMQRALAAPPAPPFAGTGGPPPLTLHANLGLINTGSMSKVDFTEAAVTPTSPKIEKISGQERIRILFLSANPQAFMPLRLDQEVREIDLALRKGEYRDRFHLLSGWAVRPSDLQICLLRHRPHIVHLSGHGGESEGIFLEGADGSPHLVDTALLARLFELFNKNLRCIVLNACYSAPQASAIASAVDCVVGMSAAVGDQAASRFASSFYQALAFGRDVREAVELSKVETHLANLADQDTPQLIATRCDPASVSFGGGRPPTSRSATP